MVVMVIVSILLTINMVLTHLDKLVAAYYWIFKKLVNPKFKVGELVLINDNEFEIILITKNSRPYTYFCLPINYVNSRTMESYYHESEIKKKTGLLKELE